MSSPTVLSPRSVRRLSLVIVPVSVALLVVGVLPAALAPQLWARIVGVVVAAVAVVVLGIAIGLRRLTSDYQDELDRRMAEAALDAEIMAATAGDACDTGSCATCASDCAVKSLPRS